VTSSPSIVLLSTALSPLNGNAPRHNCGRQDQSVPAGFGKDVDPMRGSASLLSA
jgi:hypothetical protein